MNVCFRVKGNQRIDQYTIVPFEVIRKEWKGNVGNKTADGDLIVEVTDISSEEIEVKLDVVNEKNIKILGGNRESIDFSMS